MFSKKRPVKENQAIHTLEELASKLETGCCIHLEKSLNRLTAAPFRKKIKIPSQVTCGKITHSRRSFLYFLLAGLCVVDTGKDVYSDYSKHLLLIIIIIGRRRVITITEKPPSGRPEARVLLSVSVPTVSCFPHIKKNFLEAIRYYRHPSVYNEDLTRLGRKGKLLQ